MSSLRTKVLLLLGGMAILPLPLSLNAAELSVAVASNFIAPMKQIAADFERHSGHKTRLSFGSTGQFYAQIRHGAPFAILLAADQSTPERIERESLGVPGTRFTYATGRLVLWSTRPGLVDPQGEVLKTGAFDRIALANPKVAPYGAAAMEVMTRMGVADRLAPKRVEGTSVSQAYQFVASGNAALGFVALSQVLDAGTIRAGSAWIIPSSLHEPLRQDAILLNPGRNEPAARALLNYLRGEAAQSTLRQFGYE
jgi:molybdate transport system substrate-binding protein